LAGASRHCPCSGVPSKAAKQAPESKRGTQSQSTAPSRDERRGLAIAYVNSVVIHHYPSPRRASITRQRTLHRNALWLAWSRRPLRSALRETVRLTHSRLRHPRLKPGVIQALRGLPWVLRHRRVLPPPSRRRSDSWIVSRLRTYNVSL
jgi:hypothetical protein